MAKRPAKIPTAQAKPAEDAVERPSLLLPETLDLTAATELARALLAARGSDISIDASQVRHIGGQCGQVLVSAANTWRKDRADLRIVAGSAEFGAGLRLLGLDAALEIKEVRQ